jgi:hypothetical protein
MKIPNNKEALQKPSYRYVCTECVFVYRYTLHVTRSTYDSITEDIYLYSVSSVFFYVKFPIIVRTGRQSIAFTVNY